MLIMKCIKRMLKMHKWALLGRLQLLWKHSKMSPNMMITHESAMVTQMFNTEMKVTVAYISVTHKSTVCTMYTEVEGCCNDMGFN